MTTKFFHFKRTKASMKRKWKSSKIENKGDRTMNLNNSNFISAKIVRKNDNNHIIIELPCEGYEEIVLEFVGNEEYSIEYNVFFKSAKSLKEINELAEIVEQFDIQLIEAIYHSIGNVEDTVVCITEGFYLYSFEINNLAELAREMVELNQFGEIPENIISFLDYQKLGDYLKKEGWNVHNGVAVLTY
ncbi:antirestriction protein ArdA [Sutcliffiella cohnii]|uniref:antirestriction protein ArdA n=1 Tax=Sutcliffiella cohnii TaxID=33932 RepID=UPI002E1A50E4|nr:antirestriction protein ArdA [Sutcliffiella cohnii]